MRLRSAAAVVVVWAVGTSALGQAPAERTAQKVTTPRTVYVWKTGPPKDPTAVMTRWRIEGAAGSPTEEITKALGKISPADSKFFGDKLKGMAWFLPSRSPIAAGFTPWGVVPGRKEDLLVREQRQVQGTVSAPMRFEPAKDGGWRFTVGGRLYFFAPFVYPAKDGTGFIVGGPFGLLAPTESISGGGKVGAATVSGRIRFPDDRWSPVGGGYSIKGGGLEFDESGVFLVVGTQYTFDASAGDSGVGTGARRLCFPQREGLVPSIMFSSDGAFVSDGGMLCAVESDVDVSALDKAVAARGRRIAIAPDGKSLLVKSSVSADSVTLAIYALPSLALVQRIAGIDVSQSNVWWMPDGQHIVVERDVAPDRSLSIWALATGQQTWTAKTSLPLLAISPDGKVLACAENSGAGPGYRIELIPVDDVARRRSFVAHASWVHRLAFSPDSRWLASTGADDLVKVWSVADGALLHTLAGHTWAPFGAAFSRDGRTVVSVSPDTTVRFWDAVNGRSLGSVAIGGSGLSGVALSPDEKLIALAELDGTVMLYDFEGIRSMAFPVVKTPR
jgi:DNA-binding beta-propeller fold protein YncE